jgi:DNA polymerase elongation subunit (family B)
MPINSLVKFKNNIDKNIYKIINWVDQNASIENTITNDIKHNIYHANIELLEPIIEDDESFEGAIVLEPKEGIYIDYPVAVLDYASLYPSSMISENLSHDCYVIPGSEYDNLPGIEYLDIKYDVFDKINDKKVKAGEQVCRFVQFPNNEKGMLPRILQKLLLQRKLTRKKIEFETIYLNNDRVLSGIIKEKDNLIIITNIDGQSEELEKSIILKREDTYDDFQKAVLDGLQLAYKVTANSLYGSCGAKTSQIYMKEIAACTTATGRKMILKAKDFMETHYKTETIYGDSVTGDTPLLIRYPSGLVNIETIESIINSYIEYPQFKSFDEDRKDKQQGFIDAEVWSVNSWAKINRVIRHKTNKKLYRVATNIGCVDVTEDHSLIDINGLEIKPMDCKIGETELLHTFPTKFKQHEDAILIEYEAYIIGFFFANGYLEDNLWVINNSNLQICNYLFIVEPNLDFKIQDTKLVSDDKYIIKKYRDLFYGKEKYKKIPLIILNAPETKRSYFLKGYFTNNNDTVGLNKIAAQGLFYLMKSVGWNNLQIKEHENAYWITEHNNTFQNKVIKITELDNITEETYVYDIETSQGVFHGGVGMLNLKNTDSIFNIFPVYKTAEDGTQIQLKGKEAIMPSIKMAQEASAEFKKQIKAPHNLEYEKHFWPFVLISKKRYCANKYEFDDQKYKMASMGIVLKRRDNANIVKKIFGGILDIILNSQNIKESIIFLRKSLNDLIDGKYPLEDLIISKSLKSEYKDPDKIAHKVLADRMGERDEGTRPQVNDRIQYVYIQVPEKKGQKVLQGNRIENPDYIRANPKIAKPDYTFYITNQIMKPIVQVYALILEHLDGYKKTKDYFQKEYKKILKEKDGDIKKAKDRWHDLREEEVKKLLFDDILNRLQVKKDGNQPITNFYKIEY